MSEPIKRSKYHRTIRKPVTLADGTVLVVDVEIDVYDVLQAWEVQNPALQHLIKKALQPGARGHKTREQDLADIVSAAGRAKELG